MKFKPAEDTFAKAQAAALLDGDDKAELLAIGLQQLTEALAREIKAIRSELSDIRQQLRR